MIYLKLRQDGEVINHKRVERLYALEKLHIRRRRRKKIPVADRGGFGFSGRGVSGVLSGQYSNRRADIHEKAKT